MSFSVSPSTIEFIYGDFNVYPKDCLSYSGGADWAIDFNQHSS